MQPDIRRMWINQPSTNQPDHKLHGTNVLAVWTEGEYIDVYFLSGEAWSQRIAKLSLSDGWRR